MIERTGLFAESWNVAWRKANTAAILTDKDKPFNVIKNSIIYWAADPFLFEYHGDLFIFAELYDYTKRRGGLGYCKWDGKRFGKWKKVISEQYHLSYPFIFEKDNSVFILPESGADKSLYLYRAVEFPDKWERVETIRDSVIYGDTTPFLWNERQYALTYDVQGADKNKLVLLDLDNCNGDKVLDDLSSPELRRPAGKMFFTGGRYIRPAQNCAHDYGEGLIFYQYEFIQNNYSEKEIQSIIPQDLCYSRKILLDGMHTYNSLNGFEVIDIKTRRFNLINLVCRLIGKIKR